MRLEDIFRKRRKTEPKSIVVCRTIILSIIIALLIVYTIYLLINISNDTPTLKTESRTDSSLRLPTIMFTYPYNFEITCFLYIHSSQDTQACVNYITQPIHDPNANLYIGWFSPPTDIVFEDNASNGLTALVLDYALLDQTYDYSEFIWIVAYIYYTEDSRDQTLKLADSGFVNSLSLLSMHTLYPKQMYIATYSQSERYMLKSNSLSAFGFPTGTLRVPYITAELEGGPMPSSLTWYGRLAFRPQTFVVNVEIEQRSNTILGAIGLLGGMWSIAARLYAFLLGRDTIRPWGCIQYYCCCFIRPTRSRLRKSFPVIPFQSSKASELSSSFQSETTELRKKLDALELFIQDYIADTKYLDGLDKDEYPSRLSAWLSRFDLKKGGLNEASGGVNGNVINGISTQRMSEAPTQTVYYPTSSPIAPSSITEVYSGSSHSDSYYPQPDTYANQLLYTAPQFYTSDK